MLIVDFVVEETLLLILLILVWVFGVSVSGEARDDETMVDDTVVVDGSVIVVVVVVVGVIIIVGGGWVSDNVVADSCFSLDFDRERSRLLGEDFFLLSLYVGLLMLDFFTSSLSTLVQDEWEVGEWISCFSFGILSEMRRFVDTSKIIKSITRF